MESVAYSLYSSSRGKLMRKVQRQTEHVNDAFLPAKKLECCPSDFRREKMVRMSCHFDIIKHTEPQNNYPVALHTMLTL